MDTKSKKYRPLAAWLCFFMAFSIIAFLLIISFTAMVHSNGNFEAVKAPFKGEYKSTIAFKERTGNYFNNLLSVATTASAGDASQIEMINQWLDREGDNLIYYSSNQDTGLVLKNIAGELLFPDSGGLLALPADYEYYWFFDGQKVWVIDHGKPVDIERLDSGYPENIPNLDQFTEIPADLSNSRVVLAVKDTLEKNPYASSRYYEEQQFLSILGRIYIALGLLGIAFLIYAIIRRRDKHEFDRKLASCSGRLWLEVKTILSLVIFYLLTLFIFSFDSYWSETIEGIFEITVLSFVLLFVCWWCYLILLDLIVNGRKFFTHNSLNSLLKWYRRYESKYNWQKSMIKRAYMLVGAEAVLALISVLFLLIAIENGDQSLVLIALSIAGAGIYPIYRYMHHYEQTVNDLGDIIDHIALIKSGDMKTRLEVNDNADMHNTACNLNSIQDGMKTTLTEKMKSEHMKIELITNVSHDLKTPLTSIISYVGLLEKEEGLPEHVNDYVKILAQKSDRLKNLIQDLFDLSKASSDTISLDMETIDLVRLIQQTAADMEEPISASGLTFRINLPEEPVYIISDGKKLYRIWENLITNTLKYSLTDSRVFIDLVADEQGALATIKNTSNYEMNFTEEEILQRFVRGDESRSTEGSGLGLSIAQSFTEICGGDFSIKIDGDLFKVELRFTTV